MIIGLFNNWGDQGYVFDADKYPQVDRNQLKSYERILVKLLSEVRVEEDARDLEVEAAEIVRELVPTAREAAQAIYELRSDLAYVYLAFHGIDGHAQFLKVGMSSHPEKRLYGMATGNPLDCLWAYVCPMPSRKAAYAAEQAVIRHLANHARRGEWFRLGLITACDSVSVAASISEVVRDSTGIDSNFEPLAYRDGREIH